MLTFWFVTNRLNSKTLTTAAMVFIAAAFMWGQVASAQSKVEADVDPSLKPRDAYKNGTYYNKDFGFRVSIPRKGWKGFPDPKLPNVIFVAMKEPSKDSKEWVQGEDFHPNITVGVEIVPTGIGTQDYAVAATQALEKAGWQLLEERTVTWGGQEAYEVRARRESDNVALLQRFAVVNGGAVVVASTARPKQMKSVEKEFMEVFNSFKVEDKSKKRRGNR